MVPAGKPVLGRGAELTRSLRGCILLQRAQQRVAIGDHRRYWTAWPRGRKFSLGPALMEEVCAALTFAVAC